jgi:hypothetical protein
MSKHDAAAMSTPEPYTFGQIARFAGCAYPDTESGRSFLTGLEDAAREIIEYQPGVPLDRLDDNGAISEAADSAVPIYTHTLWVVFADLKAYQEDPTELGFEGEDMTKGAQVCLYMIAERGIRALCEDLLVEEYEQGTCDTCGDLYPLAEAGPGERCGDCGDCSSCCEHDYDETKED